jgi:hypothetical protein
MDIQKLIEINKGVNNISINNPLNFSNTARLTYFNESEENQ